MVAWEGEVLFKDRAVLVTAFGFSLWHGIVTLLSRLTRVLLCTVGGRGEGSILSTRYKT